MEQEGKTSRLESPGRREALRRLAGAVLAAYIVPEVLFLSEAHAGDGPSGLPSAPSVPSSPSGSTDGDGDVDSGGGHIDSDDDGMDGEDGGSDDSARDTCNIPQAREENSISISRSDLSRSQDAVEAGYAKPLDQIWGEFIAGYDGKVLGVEFLDRKNNPRYRFRAISRTGRLETVTISAETGSILRIVGC